MWSTRIVALIEESQGDSARTVDELLVVDNAKSPASSYTREAVQLHGLSVVSPRRKNLKNTKYGKRMSPRGRVKATKYPSSRWQSLPENPAPKLSLPGPPLSDSSPRRSPRDNTLVLATRLASKQFSVPMHGTKMEQSNVSLSPKKPVRQNSIIDLKECSSQLTVPVRRDSILSLKKPTRQESFNFRPPSIPCLSSEKPSNCYNVADRRKRNNTADMITKVLEDCDLFDDDDEHKDDSSCSSEELSLAETCWTV